MSASRWAGAVAKTQNPSQSSGESYHEAAYLAALCVCDEAGKKWPSEQGRASHLHSLTDMAL